MSDEMYNRLKKLANNETNLSDEEISEAVHNIIQNDFLDTTSTSEKINLGKIYDLLDKAKFAETCEIFPDSFELILLFLKYEKSPFKAFDILDMGLEREKKRLKTIQKFGKIDFDDEDDVCEKHPYLECLVKKIVALTSLGRLRQAEETCKEYFKMDKSDAAELHNLLFTPV